MNRCRFSCSLHNRISRMCGWNELRHSHQFHSVSVCRPRQASTRFMGLARGKTHTGIITNPTARRTKTAFDLHARASVGGGSEGEGPAEVHFPSSPGPLESDDDSMLPDAMSMKRQQMLHARRRTEKRIDTPNGHLPDDGAAPPQPGRSGPHNRLRGEYQGYGAIVVLVPLAAAACFLGFGARRVMADVRPARMLGSRFVSTYEESYTEPASRAETLSYQMQKVFTLPVSQKLTAVGVMSAVLVTLGGMLYMLLARRPWKYSVFKSYTLMHNVPGADACEEELGALVAGNFLYLSGLFTFALLIGVVSDAVSMKVDKVRNGNHQVLEQRHTVVLNWNECMVPLLRQIAIAKTEYKDRGDLSRIVVLADKPKEEMDEIIAEEVLADHRNVEIITRSGEPHSLMDLKKVAVWDASTVILLHPGVKDGSRGADFDGSKNAYRLHACKMATTLLGIQHHEPEKQTVVVEMPINWQEQELIREAANPNQNSSERFQKVFADTLLAKISAVCCLQPNLAEVYNELLTQGSDGQELYVLPSELVGGSDLSARTIGEVWPLFRNATLCGVICEDNRVNFNPPDDYQIMKTDQVVFMADNMQCIKLESSVPYTSASAGWLPTPPEPLAPDPAPVLETNTEPRESLPQQDSTTPPSSTQPSTKFKRIVMLGSNERVEMFLIGLNDLSAPGTQFTIVSQNSPLKGIDLAQLTNLTVNHVKGSPLDPAVLRKANVDQSTCVRLVSSIDLEDSEAIPCFGMLTNLFDLGKTGSRANLILELVHDSSVLMANSTIQRFKLDPSKVNIRVRDTLLSGMLTQVAAQPLLQPMFMKLTIPEGSEIYITKANELTEDSTRLFSWGEICERARVFNRTAIGYVPKHGKPVLNPEKDFMREYGPGDEVVVLAENFAM